MYQSGTLKMFSKGLSVKFEVEKFYRLAYGKSRVKICGVAWLKQVLRGRIEELNGMLGDDWETISYGTCAIQCHKCVVFRGVMEETRGPLYKQVTS